MAPKGMQQGTASSGVSKKTNSLAFARTECHTCASLGDHCDRRRPQCSTCLGRGRKCAGFVTPLSWDPKRMWSNNRSVTYEVASKNPTTDGKAATESRHAYPSNVLSCRSSRSRPFRFINSASRPRKCRGLSTPTGTATAERRSGEQERPSPVAPTAAPSDLTNGIRSSYCPENLGIECDSPNKNSSELSILYL